VSNAQVLHNFRATRQLLFTRNGQLQRRMADTSFNKQISFVMIFTISRWHFHLTDVELIQWSRTAYSGTCCATELQMWILCGLCESCAGCREELEQSLHKAQSSCSVGTECRLGRISFLIQYLFCGVSNLCRYDIWDTPLETLQVFATNAGYHTREAVATGGRYYSAINFLGTASEITR
jgi:hypothetical protein